MSDLESSAIPLLTPMILGEYNSPRLDYRNRKIIATWATKTAMMFQLAMPQRRAIPQEHYTELFAHKRPPRQSHLWLSYYCGTEYRFGRFHCRPLAVRWSEDRTPDEAISPLPNGYFVTLTIGHLIFQLLGYRTTNGKRLAITRHDFASKLIDLWPRQPRFRQSWIPDPFFGFEDARLLRLERAFRTSRINVK